MANLKSNKNNKPPEVLQEETPSKKEVGSDATELALEKDTVDNSEQPTAENSVTKSEYDNASLVVAPISKNTKTEEKKDPSKSPKKLHHMPDWVKYGFPPPEFLRFNFGGINLSDHSVKVCKSVIDNDHYLIDVIDTISLPKNSILSGKIQDQEAVTKVLKKVKDTYGIDFVRLSVPEELVYLASFSIPATASDKLRSVVEFHIGDHIPLSVDEIQFDFDVIGKEGDKVTEVVVIAIAKARVSELLTLLEAADLYPLSLEVEAQAIARAVIPKDVDDEKTYLVLDLGRSRTGISIVKKGIVRYATTVSFGGDKLVAKLADLRSIDRAAAEELKQTIGLQLSEYSSFEQSEIEPIINEIVSEIDRRANFWVSQTGESIDEVLLVGGNASTPGLDEYLHDKTNLIVKVPDVWGNVFDPKETNRPVSKNESLGYAAVVGLAINEER